MDIPYRPYVDPQFERLIDRIHPPRVCIDNNTCRDCTLVKVDSQNKHGILLEMVQVLTDLDLVISKSYICSDGGWLMDVFHVTDQLGQKLRDEELIRYIEQALGPDKEDAHSVKTCLGRVVGSPPSAARRVLEITATDRRGLLSEISGVLQDMNCNIETAHLWTHNSRMACIVVAADLASCKPITDTERLGLVKDQLCNVLRIFNGSRDERRAVRVSTLRPGLTHTERRLHQMMFEDRDYDSGVEMDKGAIKKKVGDRPKLSVSLDHCIKDYSVLNILSKDRPKLLFDTICTLSDLQYVVFHAAIGSDGPLAMQEYFIQHEDGCTLKTDSERSRLVKCLEAGIERRVTDVNKGLRLEVQTQDRVGLLSDITRVFREHGLMVKRAEISTIGNKAFDTFYVAEVSGNEAVNMKIVEHIRQQFGCVVVGERSDLMTHRSGSSSNHHQHRSRNEPERQKSFSLSHMIWSQIERISHNFAHN